MKPEIFEITKLILQIIIILVSALLVPSLNKFIKQHTNKEQREDAIFWAKCAVNIAETIYNERGQGKLKKADVIKWLNDAGIKMNEEQLSLLVDMIVQEYNNYGWDTNRFIIKK